MFLLGGFQPPRPPGGGCPPAYREAPPLGLSVDLGTKILVPRSWYQDPGTKILVPGTARHGNIWHGTDHEGTARKYLARHGSIRSGHGTARDVPEQKVVPSFSENWAGWLVKQCRYHCQNWATASTICHHRIGKDTRHLPRRCAIDGFAIDWH